MEISAAVRALKSSQWASGDGKGLVQNFEKKFTKYINSKECVAVNSGTAAIHLALNVIDIKNKEVIVPSFTFITTVHAVVYNGGIPVFADVDPITLCIDSREVEDKISRKTKAIIPMHYGGFPCNMNEIKKIAKKNDLHVIDDAAHACGSRYDGKMIGADNELTCFSFHPVKNLAMPKGGAITINSKHSKKLKNILNSLRWCGIDKRDGPSYDVTSLGFNHYMDEISAAIGIEQLKKLNSSNRIRFDIAKRYYAELFIEEKMPINKNCSYHLYWIRIKNRKKIMKKLLERKIQIGSHYKPAHLMSFYKSNTILPITEKIGEEILTLPMHPNLKETEIDKVIKTINSLV